MPIIKNYFRGAGAAVASYDYTDIAEGTGVIIFQGFDQGSVSGSPPYQYRIVKGAAFPSVHIESISSDGDPDPYAFDYDFDLVPFNLPKTVKGTAMILFSEKSRDGGAATITAKLYKVSNSDETEMGSVTVNVNPTGVVYHIAFMTLTQTHFKRGDFLRLNMATSKINVTLAHDPTNRAGVDITPVATYPTKLELHVPFRIDV